MSSTSALGPVRWSAGKLPLAYDVLFEKGWTTMATSGKLIR